MFLLRSAFWLTVAFVLMAPRHVDLGATVSGYAAEAAAAGQRAIVSEILETPCTDLKCAGGKGLLQVLAAGSLSPSVDNPMQDSSSILVPLPRPRPDRMG